jgi:hypothetical protein
MSASIVGSKSERAKRQDIRQMWHTHFPDIELKDLRWFQTCDSAVLSRAFQIAAENRKNGKKFVALDSENIGKYVMGIVRNLTKGDRVTATNAGIVLTTEVSFRGDYAITERDKARFRSRLDPSGNCLLFKGASTGGGYGKFWVNRRSMAAHFFAFFAEFGYLPAANGLGGTNGLQVAHNCRWRSCCNPQHLRLTTKSVNLAERVFNPVIGGLRGGANTDYGSSNGTASLSSILSSSLGSLGASSVVTYPQVDVSPDLDQEEVSNGSPPPSPKRLPWETTHFLEKLGQDKIAKELQGVTGPDCI